MLYKSVYAKCRIFNNFIVTFIKERWASSNVVGKSRRGSTSLIAESNEFLDRLQAPKTMKEVERNIATIARIKEEMLSAGFNASYPEMMLATRKEFLDEDAISDLPKQLREFREFANLKRYTLNRIRVALASHKILYNMMQRGTTYEMAEHLPYNGQYLYDMIYSGEPAVRAYNAMQAILSRRKEDNGGDYTVVLSVNGEKQTVKLQSDQNLGDRVKRIYGEGATVLSVTRRNNEPQLVRNRSTRVAVAAAYSKAAAKKVYIHAEKMGPKMTEQHAKYATVLAKYGLSSDARIDLLEKREALDDELYSKGLLTEENEVTKLDSEIIESISKKRKAHNNATIKEAEKLFADDVMHFFVSEPKRTRSSYPLFPGISTEVDDRYSFLQVLDIDHPQKIIDNKLKLEAMVPMQSKQLGAALMHLSGKSAEWCEEKFGIPANEIKEASVKLAPYLKHSSAQAKKFLEAMG